LFEEIANEPTDTTLKSFSFDRLGRLQSATDSVGTTAYAHDDYGNVRTIGSKALTWTRRNLLRNYNGTDYSYNHQGARFQKTTGGSLSQTTYFLDGSKVLGENRKTDDQITKLRYYYDATGLSCFTYRAPGQSSASTYRYLKDALGNVTGLMEGGSVICRYTSRGRNTRGR